MKLTFDPIIVKQVRKHAAEAADFLMPFGQTKKEPGLLLVGDQGVYLMSNGLPRLIQPNSFPEGAVVAYANECNPEKMDFDAWWTAKNATFGGDDGVEFLPLSSIPESGEIEISMTPATLMVFEVA